jgi:hypothetical protein
MKTVLRIFLWITLGVFLVALFGCHRMPPCEDYRYASSKLANCETGRSYDCYDIEDLRAAQRDVARAQAGCEKFLDEVKRADSPE